eukprot:m.371716 g.371716  ORF g.371716 m.371716 type:complete len:3536 (+) comp28134_c1_seq4:358-10965(+)
MVVKPPSTRPTRDGGDGDHHGTGDTAESEDPVDVTRYLTVRVVGDGSKAMLWRYAHEFKQWTDFMADECPSHLDFKIPGLPIAGQSSELQVVWGPPWKPSDATPNVSRHTSNCDLVCFDPSRMPSFEAACERVNGTQQAGGTAVLVGVDLSGWAPDVSAMANARDPCIGSLAYFRVCPENNTNIKDVLQTIGSRLASGGSFVDRPKTAFAAPCPTDDAVHAATTGVTASHGDDVVELVGGKAANVAAPAEVQSMVCDTPAEPVEIGGCVADAEANSGDRDYIPSDAATADAEPVGDSARSYDDLFTEPLKQLPPPYVTQPVADSVHKVWVRDRPPAAEEIRDSIDLSARAMWGPAIQMPLCSLRTATVLQESCFALKTAQAERTQVFATLDDGRTCLGEVTAPGAIELANTLRQQLATENLSNPEAEQALDRLLVRLRECKWDVALMDITQMVRTTMRPFNFRLCARLVEASRDATGQLAGKDAWLLIGETGAGKTTLIHLLMGSRFVRAAGGSFVPDPSCPRAQELEQIRVSSRTRSETTFVTSVLLPRREVNGLSKQLKSIDDVLLVDTPGFGDTRGVEQGVANEIGITAAVQQARSVRVVFVLPASNVGARFEKGAPYLFQIASGIAPTILEHEDSLHFVFTGFRKDELAPDGKVPTMLAELVEDPPMMFADDESVAALIKLVSSEMNPSPPTRRNPGGAQGYHLIECTGEDADAAQEEKRIELLEYIDGGKKAFPIEEPGEVFRFNASPAARDAVQRQLEIFERLVQYHLGRFPDVESVTIVAWVLQELQYADGQIPLTVIPRQFKECVRLVVKRLDQLSCDTSAEFELQCTPSEQMREVKVEGFSRLLRFMGTAETMLRQYFSEANQKAESSFLSRMTLVFQNGLVRVLHAVVSATERNAAPPVSAVTKLTLLARVFGGPGIKAVATARQVLHTKIESLVLRLEAELGNVNGPDITADITTLPIKLSELVNTIVALGAVVATLDGDGPNTETMMSKPTELWMAAPPGAVAELMARCRAIAVVALTQTKETVSRAVKQTSSALEGSALEQCRLRVLYLEKLAERDSLAAIEVPTTEVWNATLQSIDEVVAGGKDEIDAVFAEAERKNFEGIERVMARIHPVCRELGDAVLQRTSEPWNVLVEGLSGYLRHTKYEIEADAKAFLNNEAGVNTARLAQGLTALRSAQWMHRYRPGIVDEVVGETNTAILHSLQYRAEDVRRHVVVDSVSEAACEQIKAAVQVIKYFYDARELERGIEGLDQARENFEQWLSKELLNRGLAVVHTLYSEDYARLDGLKRLLVELAAEQQCQVGIINDRAEQLLTSQDFADVHHLDARIKTAIDVKSTTSADIQQNQLNAAEVLESHKKTFDIQAEYMTLISDATESDDALPTQLSKFLEARGYSSCSHLQTACEKAKTAIYELDRNIAQQIADLEKQESVLSDLTKLKDQYTGTIVGCAEESRRLAEAGLSERGKESGIAAALCTPAEIEIEILKLEETCGESSQFTDATALKERARLIEFDFSRANNVCSFLQTCEALKFGSNLDDNFPVLLKAAQDAFNVAVSSEFDNQWSVVNDAITKALNYTVETRAAMAKDVISAKSVGTVHPDSPEGVADQIMIAVMKFERMEKVHPKLFLKFEGLHLGSREGIQYSLNEQLKSLHSKFEQSMQQWVACTFLGELEAKIEMAQALAHTVDRRFAKFDPKPMRSEHGDGNFYALFSWARKESFGQAKQSTNPEAMRLLFPSNGEEQNDLHIYQTIEPLANADNQTAQRAYKKLMLYYERSLEGHMREHQTRLGMLSSVDDTDTHTTFVSIQKFWTRLAGPHGVIVLFQPLWLEKEGGVHAKGSGEAVTSMGGEITGWLEQLRLIIAEKMSMWLRSVEDLARAKQFKDAEDQRAKVHKALRALQNHAAHLTHTPDGGQEVNIKAELDRLSETISDALRECITDYTDKSLSDYPMDPPDQVYDRLREASAGNPKIHSVVRGLKETILKKFQKDMQQAMDDCDLESSLFAHADRALKMLPKDVTEQATHVVDSAKSYVKEQSEKARGTASELLPDASGIVNAHGLSMWCKQNSQKPQHKGGLRLIRDNLLGRATRCEDNVKGALASHEPRKVRQEIEDLFKWSEKLKEYCPSVGEPRERIVTALRNAIKTWLLQLVTELHGMQRQLEGGWAGSVKAKRRRAPLFQKILAATVSVVEIIAKVDAAQPREVSPHGDLTDDPASPEIYELCTTFEAAFISCSDCVRTTFDDALSKAAAERITAVVECVRTLTEMQSDEAIVPTRELITAYLRVRPGPAPAHIEAIEKGANELDLPKKLAELTGWARGQLRAVEQTDLMNDQTRGGSSSKKSRTAFYTSISGSLRCLIEVVPRLACIGDPIFSNLAKDAKAAHLGFVQKVHDMYSAAKGRATDSADPTCPPNRAQMEELGQWIDNLVAIASVLEPILGDSVVRAPNPVSLVMADNLREVLRRCVNGMLQQAVTDVKKKMWDTAALLFIRAKAIGFCVSALRSEVTAAIDTQLNSVKHDKEMGANAIRQLAVRLETNLDPLGGLIVNEHRIFQGAQILERNELCQGIDYVLKHLASKADDIDVDALKNAYEKMMPMWKDAVRKGLRPNQDLAVRSSEAVATLHKVREKLGPLKSSTVGGPISWQQKHKSEVPRLLANLFAVWTLNTAEHYFDAEGVDAGTRDKYLMAPHAGQIVALLRMFGIGFKGVGKLGSLSNQLTQLKTGEGKSVVMAVAAMVFALLGCHVSCACYSEMLSERDYADFVPLFELLQLEEFISYGTFDALCEGVINAGADIRTTVKNVIQGTSSTKPGPSAMRQYKQARSQLRLLFIDEVDVLFSKAFYGQVYIPAALLQDPTILQLTEFIWGLRGRRPGVTQVAQSPQYKACLRRFGEWSRLIKEAVGDMLVDLDRFNSVPYVVKKDQIAYKEMDGLVFNKSYRYCTMWAYCYEHDEKRITLESRDSHIGITVRCGNFSYAETPAHFNCILGVSGTLESLSDTEQAIISKKPFQIHRQTYVPTVFGGSPPIFSPHSEESRDLFVQDRAHFDQSLREQIDGRRVKGGDAQQPRAVIVFFRDEDALRAALDSKPMEPIRSDIEVMTEELDADEKSAKIKRASHAHTITFATASFGRGTDFICRDGRVIANGGVHILQTFIAHSLSEEIQFRGRTGRQGQPGSYSLLLVREDLEQLGIRLDQLDTTPFQAVRGHEQVGSYGVQAASGALGQKFKYITDCRNRTFDEQYAEDTAHIDQLKEEDRLAFEFVDRLLEGEYMHTRDFLERRNVGAGMDVKSRTICLMDATGSMRSLLQKAKNTVSTVYSRLCDILEEKKINPSIFELQFVVYRNYNSTREKILQASPWATRPSDLESFMTSIKPDGGYGNEAIEVGLWHCNLEAERGLVSQVLLIGDAAANTPDEVISKRANTVWGSGEAYWQQDPRLKTPTTSDREIRGLAAKGIPVHSYWVSGQNGREREFFERTAAATRGQAAFLDVKSDAGRDMLTDLLSTSVLATLDASGELVKAYTDKWGVASRF